MLKHEKHEKNGTNPLNQFGTTFLLKKTTDTDSLIIREKNFCLEVDSLRSTV